MASGEACEKDGPFGFSQSPIERRIYCGWMKPALQSGRGTGLTKVFRSINAELLSPFNAGFAQQCDLGGMSIQDRHFFFLSGEVFKDQALLLTFIRLTARGLLVVIVEQFIHVCIWLYAHAP